MRFGGSTQGIIKGKDIRDTELAMQQEVQLAVQRGFLPRQVAAGNHSS